MSQNNELNQWKQLGNDDFKAGQYSSADTNYTNAIQTLKNLRRDQLDDATKLTMSQIYTNRSASRFELGLYSAALDDGLEAIQYDPCYFKAYYRTSKAYLAQGKVQESINYLFKAIKMGRPDREQRCTLIVSALLMAKQIPINPFRLLEMFTGEHNHLKTVVSLVQNEAQAQLICRKLAEQSEFDALELIINIADDEVFLHCGKNLSLAHMVKEAENGRCCDDVTAALIYRGADPRTLSVHGDPPVFGALTIGLRGEGYFRTLRHFMEFILLGDKAGKNARNKKNETLLEAAASSNADPEAKSKAMKLLREYEDTSTDDSKMQALVPGGLGAILSMLSIDLGAKEFARGEHDKAVIHLTKLLEKLGNDGPAEIRYAVYFNRSAAYIDLKRLHEARIDVKRAMELKPDDKDANQKWLTICGLMHLCNEAKAADIAVSKCKGQAKLKEHLVELLDKGAPQEIMRTAIKAANISVNVWTEIIQEVCRKIAKKECAQRPGLTCKGLSSLLCLNPNDQGSFREYRADSVNLSNLMNVTSYDGVHHVVMQLVERGARVETIIPDTDNALYNRLTRGRIASVAFVENLMHDHSQILDFMLERGEEAKEPNYPDESNLIHRAIQLYKTMGAFNRSHFRTTLSHAFASSDHDREAVRVSIFLDLHDPESENYRKGTEILQIWSNQRKMK